MSDPPKTNVFVSYSRKDLAFVDRLASGLEANAITPKIDRTEIYSFEDWWKRIQALIAAADTVIFVLSPDSVASSICHREVEYALSLGKRFAPIVCRPIHGEIDKLPPAIADLNFIFFDAPETFDQALAQLVEALKTDIGWVRTHTQLGLEANAWNAAGRPSGLLLRSPRLEEAERWIAARPPDAPAPTAETQDLILQSRRGATRRRNILTGALVAGLLVAVVLAGVAFWQRGQAVGQRRVAEAQRNEALLTQSRFLADLSQQRTRAGDAGTGMLLALQALGDPAGTARPYATEAERALVSARIRLRERFVLLGFRDSMRDAIFSPDGRLIATETHALVYLWDARTGRQLAVLKGHGCCSVYGFAFSPDSRRIVTAGYDRTVRLWDVASGRQLALLEGHTHEVRTVAFSPDGRLILSGSRDKTARLWDAATGGEVARLEGHAESVENAVFSPDGSLVATAAYDGTARIWSVAHGTPVAVLKARQTAVDHLSFDPSGRLLVTTSGTVAQIWDARSGDMIAVLPHAQADYLTGATFSPDGRSVLIAAHDGTAHLWEARTWQETLVLRGHARALVGARFSPDGHRIVTASEDWTARVWDAATGGEIAILRGAINALTSARFSPDGRQVLTASTDAMARVWDLVPPAAPVRLEGHEHEIWDIAFSPSGRLVGTASGDWTARVWKADTGAASLVLEGHEERVSSIAFSPDERRIATGANDKTARIWDAATGKQLMVLRLPKDVESVRYSADGRRLLARTTDFHDPHDLPLQVWSVETGMILADLRHPSNPRSAAFSPDARDVIATYNDDQVRVWSVQDAGVRLSFPCFGPKGATFSADGARIVLVCAREIVVYDAADGHRIARYDTLDANAERTAFSDDGRMVLVTVHGRGQIWNLDTGRSVLLDIDWSQPISAAAFSRDKRVVFTTFPDAVRAWDTATGKEVAILEGATDGSLSVKIKTSPDGRHVAIAPLVNTALLWDAPTTTRALIEEAKRAVPRCLSGGQETAAFLEPERPGWCAAMGKVLP